MAATAETAVQKDWWRKEAEGVPHLVTGDIPGPQSQAMHARTTKHMRGLSGQVKLFPVCFDRGFGITLTDVDGNKYLDFSSGIYVTSLGHCHPKVSEAVSHWAGRLMNCHDFTTPVKEQLMEKMAGVLPGTLSGVQLYSDGTSAVEAGLRAARAITSRHEFISCFRDFHGKSMGAVSCAQMVRGDLLTYGPTRAPGFYMVPRPNPYRPTFAKADGTIDIDRVANDRIVAAARAHPDLVVRCSSEFPYFPGAQRLIQWVRDKSYGRLIEVRSGFHHASDLDLDKPINWKRMVDRNGAYGCMGDLGMHVQHIPFRMGWRPRSVQAFLQNLVPTRPDGKGGSAPCETWDNATVLCGCADPETGEPFLWTLETKRMAPGATNTWFLEVYGTEGSARFSTHDPKAFTCLRTEGREQGWTRVDVGAQSAIPSITGGIFEFGFSDAFQQMIGAFLQEFTDTPESHPFRTVSLEETALSHRVFTAALQAQETGSRVAV